MQKSLYRFANCFILMGFSAFLLGQSAAPDIYVADCSNHVVRKVTGATGIITTVIGNGTAGYSGDGGPALSAELSCPNNVALDRAGNIYIFDFGNFVVRKMTAATGVITTVAGNGTRGYSGDGGLATSAPLGFQAKTFAVDAAGDIFIADWENGRIREVNASTGIITTVAGNGTLGYSGDGGPATSAGIFLPNSVALDSLGNIYIGADGTNAIRKVTVATGIITTVAGNGTSGYSGDGGPATSAELSDPAVGTLDSSGNLYIVDSGNSVVRKVTVATGIITTIAGNGTKGDSGDGGAATSAELDPFDAKIDSLGNIYVADYDDNVLRMVAASTGVIRTVAGTGATGYTGDGGAATSATFSGPAGIALVNTIATPIFTPPAGTYGTAQSVTITTTTSGATIYYTTNGNTPSSTTGILYSSPVPINTTTPLKAIAYAAGYANSAVATAAYTILPPPSVSGVSPTSGTAGTQVTVTGSNFGSTRGTGAVWLGSTLGTVVSWSNTQIVGTVASNATSGTVQVQQNGVLSTNGPAFTVSTATITSVSPASGLPGTQVTIIGSGFGATQGTGQVWLGTMNGVVQSWSNTQIVATVATGSATGKAQVLQNGVWSNSSPFSVNTLQITSVSPVSGAVGTTVTITGAGFGASQGGGTVLLGSINGAVISWTDTQVMASVASGSLTGVVRVQQNAVFSNAKSFTVPVSGGGGVTPVPNVLNMTVGDTHTIQALGSTGQSVTGLTWASSNTSVVSLSTSDPPILTALAVGHVTITAGTASADVTVSASLPLGTVLWSNPGNGSGVAKIIPAVPSATGVADVFALQNDGTVAAITSDGTTAWTYSVPSGAASGGNPAWTWAQIVPDFQGGFVVSDGLANNQHGAIRRIDGITGQAYPTYNPPGGLSAGGVVVHTDGTIFAIQTGNNATSVIGIDPTSGSQKFSVPISIPGPPTDLSNCPGNGGTTYSTFAFLVQGNGSGFPNLIVAGDGNAYLAFGYNEFVQNCLLNATHFRLLRVNSSGSSNVLTILDTQPDDGHGRATLTCESTNFTLGMITNADIGVALSWSLDFEAGEECTPGPLYGMAITTGSSVSVVPGPIVPPQPMRPAAAVVPVLQAQDGSFVGTLSVPGPPPTYSQTNMVAFDASGNVRWVVPNETPQIATADGGVITQSGTTYDQNGNATGQMALATQSWTFNSYQIGSIDQVLLTPLFYAFSYAPEQSGTSVRRLNPPQEALYLLTQADLTANPQCNAVMAKFATIANETEAKLIAQLQSAARNAMDHVEDGANSQDQYSSLGDPYGTFSGTVALWFYNHDNVGAGYADGLSSFIGPKVYLRFGDWYAWFPGWGAKFQMNNLNPLKSKLNSYALGTVMHELMHKQAVGGGFTHNTPADSRDFMSAINAAVSPPTYVLFPNYHSDVSDALGQYCFPSRYN